MSPPSWRRRLEHLLGVPATEGNRIDILRNGDQIFEAMLDEIRSARRCIDFLTFVYWQGEIATEFAEAFEERASAGLRVRVLLDTLGARHIEPALIERMRAAGADVRWFRPLDPTIGRNYSRANHRTHRKILICDETVGFTGGVGIAQEWTGKAASKDEWRDTHFRVVGPAVSGLHGAFIDNWIETGPLEIDHLFDHFPEHDDSGSSIVQVIRGAAEAGGNDVANLMEILIHEAEERLWITTAYFNPDEALMQLLVDAAQRGVDVEVLVPGRHADKRFVRIVGEANYQRLLEAGITVRVYDTSMLHAKIMTVDGDVATVGSSNLNQRSAQFDEEVNLVIFDPEIVAELDADFRRDLANSTEISLEEWGERSRLQRAAERAASMVADLI
jgi:cardiolipin synthase